MQPQKQKNTQADWFKEQHRLVNEYLDREEIRLVKISQRPVWFVSPYVALWKTRNLKSDAKFKIWVISGDLPTDYFEATTDQSAREVMLAFAERWKSISKDMAKGKTPKNVKIGRPEDRKSLGPLLKTRAEILSEWAATDELWQ